MDNLDFYTIKEVAGILKISEKTVRRRIQKDELQAEKREGAYGSQYFLPKNQFDVAEHIISVVDVKKQYDLQELALSLNVYLTERDDNVLSEIENIKSGNSDLKDDMHRVKLVVAETLINLTDEVTTLKDQNALILDQNEKLINMLENQDERLELLRTKQEEKKTSFWSSLFNKETSE